MGWVGDWACDCVLGGWGLGFGRGLLCTGCAGCMGFLVTLGLDLAGGNGGGSVVGGAATGISLEPHVSLTKK